MKHFRQEGIPTQAAVAPLMPLDDPMKFAAALEKAADRIVLDHYLIGDGSAHGFRTRKTGLESILRDNGYAAWTTLDKFQELVHVMERVLGKNRVLVGQAGFNEA